MSPACFGQGLRNSEKAMRRTLLKNIRRDVPTAFVLQHSGRSDQLADLADFIKSNFTIKYLLNSFLPGNPLSGMGFGTISCAWLSFPDECPRDTQPLKPLPNTHYVKAPKTPDVVLKWDGEVIKTGVPPIVLRARGDAAREQLPKQPLPSPLLALVIVPSPFFLPSAKSHSFSFDLSDLQSAVIDVTVT